MQCTSSTLTPAQVKQKLRERGFSASSYARMIRKHPATVGRIMDGKIGGELRERFFSFLGIPEEQRPPVRKTYMGRYLEPSNGEQN